MDQDELLRHLNEIKKRFKSKKDYHRYLTNQCKYSS